MNQAGISPDLVPLPRPLATCSAAGRSATTQSTQRDWLWPRVIELSYTASDLQPFAEDCGHPGPPFQWDPTRRAQLRAELDAAFFQLYGLSKEDTAYILDTFPVVKRNEEKAHGEYRTKRLILEAYDALAEATRTGTAYVSPLNPPPADPAQAHEERTTR